VDFVKDVDIAPPGLLKLDLSNNNIGNRGAMLLGLFLRRKVCIMQHLVVSNCKIQMKGAFFIFGSLKTNKNLESLVLNENHIGT
jgi:hypothetical protein